MDEQAHLFLNAGDETGLRNTKLAIFGNKNKRTRNCELH
jgi:hypothetical protein